MEKLCVFEKMWPSIHQEQKAAATLVNRRKKARAEAAVAASATAAAGREAAEKTALEAQQKANYELAFPSPRRRSVSVKSRTSMSRR